MSPGWKIKSALSAAAALVFGCFPGISAASPTIYVAYDEAGTPRFSTQAYDKSYTVFQAGDEDPQPSPAAVKAARRRETLAGLDPLIRDTARKYRLEPALLRSVIATESGFDSAAVSPRGAIGLMQVMPATGQRYGITELHVPDRNLEAGAHYLRDLLDRYDLSLPLALAAYNAGEHAVERHGRRIPPYRETRAYVPAVLNTYAAYRLADGETPPSASQGKPAKERQRDRGI